MLKSRIEKFGMFVSLRPFVFLGNIVGIFPCKYVNKRIKAGGMTSRCYVFLFFGTRMYVSIAQMSLPKIFTREIVISIVFALSVITLFVSMTTDFFISAFQQNHFVKFFDKLAIYDEKAAKLGHPHRDRYSMYWIFLGLMGVFVYQALQEIQEAERGSTWKIFAWKTMHFVSQPLIYRLSILRFDILVHLMYQRFRHLNKSILPSVSWTRKLSPQNLNSVTASDVLFLHATLVDAARIINDAFSLMLLCSFSSLFFTAIIDIYLMHFKRSTSPLVYCYSVFAAIFITCAVCHITAEEANSTSNYMVKDEPTLVEDSTTMDRVRMQLYLFHNRVIFSGGDFFVISLPIFYSMLVSIFTYGVLLTTSS